MEAKSHEITSEPPLASRSPGSDRGGADAAQWLAAVVESSDDAILTGTLDGTITSWNAAAERIYGYPAREMIGQSIARVRPEGHLAAVADVQARLAAGRSVPHFETRELRKDGTLFDVSISISPVMDAAGRVTGFASIVRDVTDRRAAGAATRLLAEIVETSQDAIVARDLDGTVRAWNPAAEHLFGYAAQDMIGRSTASLWDADPGAFEALQSQLAAGERVPPFDATLRRADGRAIDALVTASAMEDSEGTITGASVIYRDVSDAKRAERALRETERLFRLAFQAAPTGVALVAIDGSWLAVNPSLCELTARTEAELLATDFQAITHPDDIDADLAQLRRTLDGTIDGYHMDKRYLRPDGSAVWADLGVSLVRDVNGEPLYFVAHVRDITERKGGERELLRYAEQLDVLALEDQVTGLRSYRDFRALLETEVRRSRRGSVVLLDIDGFRAIHALADRGEGDRMSRAIAEAIGRVCRRSDFAARGGGCEFVLALPGATPLETHTIVERIDDELVGTDGVSPSFGVGCWPIDGESAEAVLHQAGVRVQRARSERERSTTTLQATAGVERILELARSQLGMGVAYVAEVTESSLVIRATAGDRASLGLEGACEMPLSETYCQRMLDGRIDSLVTDTSRHPELAALPVTEQAGLGSYIGVPVTLKDGRVFGTLCCFRHGPAHDLDARHVELLRFLSVLLADQIQEEAHSARAERARAELAGVRVLLSALAARDHYTGEHSQVVVRMARAVALRLGLSEQVVAEVEQVALLHDIGKVGIPDSVLLKGGPLTAQESDLMRQHPAIGARILSGTTTLAHLASPVKAEHERYDGDGYPDGLSGEQIPLASRITFVCDAYHAMTSDRPYRAALRSDVARGELRAGAGGQFDPRVVDALLAVLDKDPPGLALTGSVRAAGP